MDAPIHRLKLKPVLARYWNSGVENARLVDIQVIGMKIQADSN